MITQDTDRDGAVYWYADATRPIYQFRDLGPFHGFIQATGRRGDYAGVLVGDYLLTVGQAREYAAALLAHAEIAEQQAAQQLSHGGAQ
ncbi:hypothetical protein [Mycolicibacterium mageritense]|uniref:Uncharacterized protein n=1 Tax=Mycolicibacterium mageritense TaxID=53462 RepID=A0AAI8U2H4_MYCME|nr:hypothetical protein [Mycolicibacterium mageritense]BDY32987.1 hypothetical protein hbim_06959 [Mycolicibacterium mageritense]